MDTPSSIDADHSTAMPSRTRDRLLVVLFLLILSAPAVAMAIDTRPGNYLNRPLAPFPTLTVAGVSDASFFAGMDAFVNENFPVRADAILLKSAFQYGLLREGTNPSVALGLDGWLFHKDSATPVCPHTADEVFNQVDDLASRLALSGTAFRFVVAPDKRTIYPERLPDSMRIGTTCTDTGRAELRAGMAARPDTTIDLWEPVIAERAQREDSPVYWAHDTHWNAYGAVSAVREVVERLAPGTWADEDIVPTVEQQEHIGDLTRRLGLRDVESADGLEIHRHDLRLESVTSAVERPIDQRMQRFASAGRAPVVPGRTLIVGDSFFLASASLLAPWFRELTLLPISDLERPEMIDQLGAVDLIIVERVEREAYATDYEGLLSPLITHLEAQVAPS